MKNRLPVRSPLGRDGRNSLTPTRPAPGFGRPASSIVCVRNRQERLLEPYSRSYLWTGVEIWPGYGSNGRRGL